MNATTSSNLVVSFTGAGDCTVTSTGTVHLTGAGNCAVTASQADDGTYNPALPVTRSFTVGYQDWSLVFFADQHPDPTTGAPIAGNAAYALAKQAAWKTMAYVFTGDTNNDFPAGMWWHGWNSIVGSGLPEISAIGNHDCLDEDCAGPTGSTRATTNRTSVFDAQLGYARVSGASCGPVSAFSGTGNDLGYYPDSSGSRASYAIRFAVNGHKFLFIALELFPRDAVMTWAAKLAAVYPDHKVALFDSRISGVGIW